MVPCFVLCGLAVAQQNSGQDAKVESPKTAETISQMELGSISAIRKAGASGDRVFVPYLRKQLAGAEKEHSSWAHLALAKLGEPDQLQQLRCEVYAWPEPPAAALTYVGGWFAIQMYEKLLDDWKSYPKNSFRRPDKRDIDVLIQPPSWYALMELPKIVPDPPLQVSLAFSESERQGRIKIWKAWIAEHRESLSRLAPTGEGVNFDDSSCKRKKR